MARILFTGDVFLADQRQITLSKEVSDIIAGHDMRCCNFEGVCPVPGEKLCPIKKAGPRLLMRSSAANEVVQMGFSLCTLANNHICDYGTDGMFQTIRQLSGATVIGAGNKDAVYQPFLYKTSDGMTIGVLNAAEWGFGSATGDDADGYAWLFHRRVTERINKLKNTCNFLIMVIHAGLENVPYPLPEWRDCYHGLIDRGVNLIVAHHPHVIQGYEHYNDGMIFYSLGNFLWEYGNTAPKYDTVMLSIEINPSMHSDPNPELYNIDHASGQHLHAGSFRETPHRLPALNFRVIECTVENGVLSLSPQSDNDPYIEKISEIFENDDLYLKKMNDACKDLYEKYYKDYYLLAGGTLARIGCTIGAMNGPLSRLSTAAKVLFTGTRINETFLRHNLLCETNDYLVKRALL